MLYVDSTGDVTYAEPDGETVTIENKTVIGKNMLNPNDPDFTTSYFLNASGNQVPCGEGTSYNDTFGCSGYMAVTPGETYTYTCIPTTEQTGNIRIHCFDANKNWKSQLFYTNGTSWAAQNYNQAVTIPEGAAYVRCNILHKLSVMDSTLQFEKGSTATSYEPYTTRQANQISATASIPFSEIESYVAQAVEEAMANVESFSAPKITNPNCRTDKSTFRVLDIGNSFTQDCVAYLPNLVSYLVANKGLDVSNISFSKAYRGGASYKNWFDIFHDQDTSDYSISKDFGGLTETYTGGHAAGNGEMFRNCLKDHHYDLIIIHQVSTYSGTSDSWEGTGTDGYLKEFIQLLRYYQPQAHIGFLMVHASPRQQKTGETTTREQWRRIADSANWIARNYDMDFIVPAGTAVENLRISNIAPNAAHQLTRDNHHMADGLCRYTGTCAYWESVFAPYFGISCYNSGWVYQSVTPPSGYETDTVQITAVNAQVAQMCAMLANTDRYTLNNPDGKYIGPESEVPTPPEPEPTPTPEPVEQPSATPLPDNFYESALTLEVGPNKGTTGVYEGTGKVCPGYWYFSNTTSGIQNITSYALKPTHSTNAYYALDLVLPVGSVIEVPAGIFARPVYTNTAANKELRGNEFGSTTTATTVVLGSEMSSTNWEALHPDSAYVHFYIKADSGSSHPEVTEAYITQALTNYPLIIKPLKPQYNQVTLGTDNVGKGWWTIRDTAGGSYIATGGQVLDYYETFIMGNGTTHSMIALPAVPVGSKLILPDGMTCRRNFYNADTKKWIRMSTTNVASGSDLNLTLNYENEYGELPGGAQYCVVQVFRTGRDGSDTVDDTYLNAMISDGIELWTPASPWTTMSLNHENSLAGFWCWKDGADWPTDVIGHEDELLNVTYVGIRDNASTQSYISLPEVPVGSRLTITSGYTVRINYTDENHTQFYRESATTDTTETTTIVLYNPNVNLNKACVHIKKIGDASSALVTDSYIDTQVTNCLLETPNS